MKQKQNNLIMSVIILVVGVLIAGAIIYSSSGNSQPTTKTVNNGIAQIKTEKTAVNIKNVKTQNEPFIGSPDAPVTIAYWFDFQCPFCKRFEDNTLPILINKYVKTGKVRIVFKDFQFLGPDSQDAGLVENAMWALYPNQYENWHNLMFAAQDAENSGFGDLNSIYNLISTKMPGINLQRVKQEVKQNKSAYLRDLNDDRAEGAKFGINGTPGFIIGNQIISGAQPTSVFVNIINSELNNK